MSGLFDVSKEIILVTGASQGLGRQFARVLSAHGAAVVLAARQTNKLKSLEILRCAIAHHSAMLRIAPE